MEVDTASSKQSPSSCRTNYCLKLLNCGPIQGTPAVYFILNCRGTPAGSSITDGGAAAANQRCNRDNQGLTHATPQLSSRWLRHSKGPSHNYGQSRRPAKCLNNRTLGGFEKLRFQVPDPNGTGTFIQENARWNPHPNPKKGSQLFRVRAVHSAGSTITA